MSQLGPAQVVQWTKLSPPTVSLIAAAIQVDETDERWVNALNYVPEGCGTSEIFAICDSDFEKTDADSAAPITGTPYGLVAQDTCSTFSYLWRDYAARATRQLLATESFQLAKELWEGNLGTNPFLSDPATQVVGTGIALNRAIGKIEKEFYDDSPGVRLMLHMSPFLLESIQSELSAGVLERRGDVWYTSMDSIIAVDKGYPGTGPSGASGEWIFATPVVTVRRGPISVIPNNLSEAVLRTSNRVTYFAERAAQATWDYNCATQAISVAV